MVSPIAYISDFGPIMPDTLVIWPLWRFLLAAALVSFLKLTLLTFLGTAAALLTRHLWAAVGNSLVLTGLYLTSQFSSGPLPWNPLAVASGWSVTEGRTAITWLNAVLLLMAALIICLPLALVIHKKRDVTV